MTPQPPPAGRSSGAGHNRRTSPLTPPARTGSPIRSSSLAITNSDLALSCPAHHSSQDQQGNTKFTFCGHSLLFVIARQQVGSRLATRPTLAWFSTKRGRHSALIASSVPPTLHGRQATLGIRGHTSKRMVTERHLRSRNVNLLLPIGDPALSCDFRPSWLFWRRPRVGIKFAWTGGSCGRR